MFLGLKQDFENHHATPLEVLEHQWSVVKSGDQWHLVSNVCPHQYSKILRESGLALVCPYHGFAFDLDGLGINNQCKLQRRSCFVNGDIIFDQPVARHFPVDLSHFNLVTHRCDTVRAPVQIIMDVFLDIDHIPVAHPGVYDSIGIIDTSAITYNTFYGGSIQLVPVQDNGHMIDADKRLGIGACWMAVYPGTMIEWQPGALFVTVALSDHVGSKVYVYQYRDSRYQDSVWANNVTTWETAWQQDRALSENIVRLGNANLDALKQHHRNYYAQ